MASSGFRLSPRVAAVCLGGLCLSLNAGPLEAEVTSVTVDYQSPMGTYNGLTYTYVEATMTGTIDRPEPQANGNYSVGVMMIFPLAGGNGVGLVDWPNSSYFHYYGLEFCPRHMYPICDGSEADTQHRLEDTYIRFSRLTLEDYPWNAGYTWISVAWDKAVADLFGDTVQPGRHNRLIYGSVERGTDGDFILQDAARFLRNPVALEGADGLAAVETVIGVGYSQGSVRQNAFLLRGFNSETDGSLVYDGFLMMASGGPVCWPLTDDPPLFEAPPVSILPGLAPCPEILGVGAGDAKIVQVVTESEPQLIGAALSRGGPDFPNYVQYELAGVTHLPPPVFDPSWVGATKPNPADPRPFMRGALRNLTDWIVNGTEPPPPAFIEGQLNELGNLIPAVDADGNALGGIRLPHMPTMIDGEPAGAPTGRYGGVDLTGLGPPLNIFVVLGGTYDRFSEDELAERYPSPEVYRELVTRSADALLQGGYILPDDRDAYAAGLVGMLEMPEVPDDGMSLDDGDNGCSTAPAGRSGRSLPGAGGFLGLLACLSLLGRRRGARGRS